MNRKNLFLILAVLALYSTAFSGCSENNERENFPAETAAVNNYVPKETDKTVSGEVTKITGNRITLALGTVSADNAQAPEQGGDMPEMGGEPPQFDGNMPDGDITPPEGGMPERGGEKPDFGGERPEMGGRSGGRKGGSSVQKTGEEAQYILPVGMPIDGLSGRSTDYSGVTAGTVITLTVNEQGVVCAAEVS
ncbi:MAG: hypothetical protein ACI4J0_09735 [Huintestinicola sp.]|uniref:hypothetical protein n=1 Tax=Huintestinicola sp. TaxID=2981661 RepID=UPI003EFF7B51